MVKIAIILTLLIFLLSPQLALGYDSLKYSADIDGKGTVWTYVDTPNVKSFGYCENGDFASGTKLNESGSSSNLVSGFAMENNTGFGSFKVMTKSDGLAHTVQVSRSGNLFAQTASGVTPEAFVTRYDISGSGMFSENIVERGTYGRPNYIRSVVGNGSNWSINESLEAGVVKFLGANSTFNAEELSILRGEEVKYYG